MKYYVVADVHGFYTPLIEALTEKGFFTDTGPRKLIVCGDLFDRGREAVKLQDFLIDLLEKDELILVRGNHEDLILEFVADHMKWLRTSFINSPHWENGTVETVMDLTGLTLQELSLLPKEMKRRMENTPFFQRLLPAMVDYFETERYIFVHGWIPAALAVYPGKLIKFFYKPDWRNATPMDWYSARWYNGMEAARQGVFEENKTIVCGHWHCSYGHAEIEKKGEERGPNADYSPYYGEGVIAIDACTLISGKVNCIVLED